MQMCNMQQRRGRILLRSPRRVLAETAVAHKLRFCAARNVVGNRPLPVFLIEFCGGEKGQGAPGKNGVVICLFQALVVGGGGGVDRK